MQLLSPPKIPAPTPPPPVQDTSAADEARRRALAVAQAASGRTSTLLVPVDPLGDRPVPGARATLFGQ